MVLGLRSAADPGRPSGWASHRPELGLAAFFVAVAMGSQNAVLAQVKGFRAGTTFVTGALFSLGQKIAQALDPAPGDPSAGSATGWSGSPCSFGAFLGALAYGRFALYALIAPAAVSGVLALITAFLVLRAGAARPPRRLRSPT